MAQAPRRAVATEPASGPSGPGGPAVLTGIPGDLAGLAALAGTTGAPNGLAGTTAVPPRTPDHAPVARRAAEPIAAGLRPSRTM